MIAFLVGFVLGLAVGFALCSLSGSAYGAIRRRRLRRRDPACGACHGTGEYHGVLCPACVAVN